MKKAIEVENLSKLFHIGHESKAAAGTGTFRDAMAQIGKKPLELLTGHRVKQEEFWALKDVNFEVEQGDIVGIVGQNGSGKSTLLKVLSRIIEPTEGKITMRGKVASLLEVGTGFHPELTGRENVYFNGAILGMSKKEIERKFDAIVDFSEVEKFLDTPVKFYSSGMYVRLAFSVAVHLDPDILIVDEVLAVGDAAFQKKSLAKMREVAQQGRTVLFVSHSPAAVMSLCKQGIWMNQGKVAFIGTADEAISQYMRNGSASTTGEFVRSDYDGDDGILASAVLTDTKGEVRSGFNYGEDLRVTVKTKGEIKESFGLELRLKNSRGEFVAYASSWIDSKTSFDTGDTISIVLPSLHLVQDTYFIDFVARIPHIKHVDNWWDCVRFSVLYSKPGLSPTFIQSSDDLGSVILNEVIFKKC